MPEKATSLTREEFDRRLWPRVKIGGPDECWLWTGGIMRNARRTQGGYGMISAGSKTLGTNTMLYVHREVHRHLIGPIPTEIQVCHTCDVRICCNPQHLFLGTLQENLMDKFQKRRHTFGETQPRSKLTDAKVQEIFRLVSEGQTHKEIAEKMGVSRSIISRVIIRDIWSHVLI